MLDGLDLMIDGDDANEGDVYFQLAQKEKYLLIAAEAGNTLLKKNNELQTKLNCMEKEYCNQIDVSISKIVGIVMPSCPHYI